MLFRYRTHFLFMYKYKFFSLLFCFFISFLLLSFFRRFIFILSSRTFIIFYRNTIQLNIRSWISINFIHKTKCHFAIFFSSFCISHHQYSMAIHGICRMHGKIFSAESNRIKMRSFNLFDRNSINFHLFFMFLWSFGPCVCLCVFVSVMNVNRNVINRPHLICMTSMNFVWNQRSNQIISVFFFLN